jgi:hypothetical protein
VTTGKIRACRDQMQGPRVSRLHGA